MVDFSTMTVSALAELVEAYPWFAPARAAMCVKILEQSGSEASEGHFRESIAFFPDAGYVAGRLRDSRPTGDFSDSELADMIRTAVQERPRVVMAGMDYFSRDEYDAVRKDGDSSISRIAAVDSSLPAEDPKASESEVPENDMVTETLAQIYVDQGYPDEAIAIYNKLILQSPEKSAYFASLIDKLKS